MGNSLPLPAKVPVPTPQQATQLLKYNITVDAPVAEQKYGKINLPPQFKMHDNSYRADIPIWYIIQTDTRAAVASIRGTWKETYDNKLKLEVYDVPTLVTLRDETPEPCETSPQALASAVIKESNGDPAVVSLVTLMMKHNHEDDE